MEGDDDDDDDDDDPMFEQDIDLFEDKVRRLVVVFVLFQFFKV